MHTNHSLTLISRWYMVRISFTLGKGLLKYLKKSIKQTNVIFEGSLPFGPGIVPFEFEKNCPRARVGADCQN